MTYKEMKQKHQEEFNDFPKIFAFSEKQLQEGLDKMGIEREKAAAELIRIPAGGLIRRTDKQKYLDLFARFDAELMEAMKNYDFAVNAFEYELGNHEYMVTYEVEDAVNAIGLSDGDFKENPMLIDALKAAKKLVSDWYQMYG